MAPRKRSPAKGKKPSAASVGKENHVSPVEKTVRKKSLPPPPPESPRRSPQSPANSRTPLPLRYYKRGGDDAAAATPSLADGIQHRTSLTPWMTGGNLLRAPSKPKLTVPKNWTTRSGRFRPSESGWGFDARSTVGRLTALSVFSGMAGGGGSHASGRMGRRRELDDEDIQDPEAVEAFQKDLEEKGIKQVIVVDGDWQSRSNISVVSMSDASYILDLAHQKQFRGKERQEEALEEAFILYKAALAEGAADDEQMFFMLLNEVKKELDEKYKEKDRKNDADLESALEAEIQRREKAQSRKGMQDSEHDDDNGVDVGRRKSKVSALIADEEFYHEVDERQQQYQKDISQTLNNVKQVEYTRGPRPKPKAEIDKNNPSTKHSGFFCCCGKDVEDSVLIATTKTIKEDESKTMQHRDPSFFNRLRKKQAEEEEQKRMKQEIELSDDDMWWKDKIVEVNVPEIEDDIPSTRTRGTESKASQDTTGQKRSVGSTSSNESLTSRKSEPFSLSQKSPKRQDVKLQRRKSNPSENSSKSPRHKKASLSPSGVKNRSPRKEKGRSLSPKKSRKSKTKSPNRSKNIDTESADSNKVSSGKKKSKKLKPNKSSTDLPSLKKEKKEKKRYQSMYPPGNDSSEFLNYEKSTKKKSQKKSSGGDSK